MIINKLSRFYTDEDNKKITEYNTTLDSIFKDGQTLIKNMKEARDNNNEALFQDIASRLIPLWSEKFNKADNAKHKIYKDIEQRYIHSFKDNTNAILEDVKDIINSIEKEDYIKHQTERTKDFKRFIDAPDIDKNNEYLKKLKGLCSTGYSNCYYFILENIRVQLNAVTFYGIEEKEAVKIAEEKAYSFFPVKRRYNESLPLNNIDLFPANQKYLISGEPYLPLLNGSATNQLTSLNTVISKPMIDEITGSATIEKGNLKVFIENYNEITGGLRVSTSKLLDVCTMALTQQNHYRGQKGKIQPEVVISLDEYMKLCGVPNTKASKDKTRRKIKEDLDALYHISIEWTENSGKNQKDFAKMRICSEVGFRRGNIKFCFSPPLAQYLTNAYIMQYPLQLLSLDERNANVYPLGRKIRLHNSIENNRKKGTSNIISVKSLLEVCPAIPTYKEVMATDRHIDKRIKQALEKALNALPFMNWEYSNSKGEKLTEEQLTSTDYSIYSKLYVKFKIIDIPDQSKRLNTKEKKRAN